MDRSLKAYKLKRLYIIIIGILLALHLAGCTSSKGSAEFPIGLFDCVECQGFTMRYSTDGTPVVYSQGEKWFTGKWRVEDNILYTVDSLCFDKEEMSASYKWKFDGEILTLRVI